jgi:hypothetical protein
MFLDFIYQLSVGRYPCPVIDIPIIIIIIIITIITGPSGRTV